MIRRAVLEQAVMFSYGETAARCQQRRMTPERHAPLNTVTSELLSALKSLTVMKLKNKCAHINEKISALWRLVLMQK